MAQRRRRAWGSGSIEEIIPGKKYRVRAPARRDPATGKRRQPSRIVNGTRSDAQAALDELRVTAKRSGAVTALTVDRAVERFLREADIAVTTRDDYERVWRLILSPLLGSVRLDQLDTPTIYNTWVEAAGTWSDHRLYRAHTLLSATCREARRWGWMRDNPARGAGPREPRRPEEEAVDSDVLLALVAELAARPDLYVWLTLAAVTGARRSEVVGIQWRDIDWERRALAIRRAVVYTPAAGVVAKDTKTKKPRTVALEQGTLDLLRALYERPGQPIRPTDHVLTLRDGRPWRPDYATRTFGKLRSRVPGAEAVELRQLRHAAGTHLIAAGHSVVDVAARLGHDPKVLLARYAKALPASGRALSVTMEELLSRGRGSPDGGMAQGG